MVCIYTIQWGNRNKVYVGQTQAFAKRRSQHLADLKAHRHKNHKLQKEYDLLGIPEIDVLEEVAITELDVRERFWIQEFDSIAQGYNIVDGGEGYKDKINTPGSKYSKLILLKVFRSLYTTTLSYRDIAKKFSVDKNLPYRMCSGNHYLWIGVKYPKLMKRVILKRVRQCSLNRQR